MTLHEKLIGSLALEDEPKETTMSTSIIKPEPANVAVTNVAVTPMNILQMAFTSGASIDNLTRLLELQERWEATEARKAFNAAMARFKANPPQISKNKHVKFNTSKGVTEYDHATLDHVVDQVGSALSAVGISHNWRPQQDGAKISITCILTHEMGHSESFTLSAMPDDSGGKNVIQQLGSTVSYLQRYTLLAATGLATGNLDNDGAGSSQNEMAQEEFDRLCGLIEYAGSSEALKSIYLAACADAKELDDKGAIKKFAELKDKRYKELVNANR